RIACLDGQVCCEKKRGPENRRSHRKMIVEQPPPRVLVRQNGVFSIAPSQAESGIRADPILREIEPVFDQKSPAVRVISNAVAAHPRVHQWKSKNKQAEQALLVAGKVTPVFQRVHEPCETASTCP